MTFLVAAFGALFANYLDTLSALPAICSNHITILQVSKDGFSTDSKYQLKIQLYALESSLPITFTI